MKNSFSVILVIMLACSCIFANGTEEKPTTSNKEVRLVVGSGPIGGAFYPIAGGVAAIINQYCDGVSATVQVTAGGVENTRLVGLGELDIALSSAQQCYDAVSDSGIFAGEGLNIKILGTMHATVCQIITLADSGIMNVQDLKGKKVAIGEAGGGAEQQFKEMIAALGWTEKDVNMVYLPYDQAMDQLGDGLIDAGCVYSGLPAAAVTNLASRRSVRLVNVDPSVQKKWESSVEPFLSTFSTYPVGTYAGMDAEATTAVQRIQLSCKADLDEEVCYKITKALYDHLDELYTYHASAKSVVKEDSAKVVGADIAEGSLRYFKEEGLIK